MQSENPTVFYAWQSDTPARENRNFIEDAAKKALERIIREGTLESSPRLDKDTKDVPGTPDIINTIFLKIKMASAFLADLTFVGKTFDDNEPISNPNVLIELGYAFSELGSERVVCTMNTYYGKASELPFDLKYRRWPIDYNLPSEGISTEEKKIVKEKLINDLFYAFQAILQKDKVEKLQPNNIEKIRESVIDRIANQNFFEGITNKSCYLILSVIPKYDIGNKIELSKNEAVFRKHLVPMYSTGWDFRFSGDRFVVYSTYSTLSGVYMDAVAEISDRGIINSIGYNVIKGEDKIIQTPNGEEITVQVIPSPAFEKIIIESMINYLNLLQHLDVKGPWLVAIGILNLGKSIIYSQAGGFKFNRIFQGGNMLPNPLEINGDIETNDKQIIAQKLRPIFDYIWREFNYPGSIYYTSQGIWNVR